MKKKSALFLLLIGGTMLSGCIGNPKLEEDTIGEIISEKDPVYDYLQGYVDNVSLVKEKDDGDSKTVWVKTTTEFDNFTYEGSYVIDCGLYSKNGNKEWDVNNFQIDYEDIRFIPTQYDYTGTWMSENAEYCFYMNQFDWENGKIGAVDELLLQNFSRDLIGYIDDSDNILHFGMKTRNSDELKLDFNSEKYDENYMVIQAFDVYHFGEKCYHISNEQMGISGITYTDFASEDGYEYRDEDYNMANCLQLKTKDGEMVLNASALLYSCGGTSEVCVDEDVNYQSHPRNFLKDYTGICVTDGYQVYHTLEKEREDLRIAGCWVHCRRRFYDALEVIPKAHQKESILHLFIKQIQAIYREEGKLAGLSSEERLAQRQLVVKPLVDAFFAYLK